jgi:cysteine synthase
MAAFCGGVRTAGMLMGVSRALKARGCALQLARELGPGKTVATVAVDSGFKHLAGDLYHS